RSQIHILANAFGRREGTDWREGADIARTHEEVVVFDTNRPIRSEADLDAGTDRATPASVGCGGNGGPRDDEGAGAVVDHGRAALDVQENVVPSVPNLPGDEAETVDFGFVSQSRRPGQSVQIAALEVSPVALALDAKHPAPRLPAKADLAAGGAARRVVAAL